MLSDLLYRLRALFRRNAVEGELDNELRWTMADRAPGSRRRLACCLSMPLVYPQRFWRRFKGQ